eukprot:gnl/TRDRNA2_/TRDRNA2_88687_c1_seq1.p2 gnl/TRDRNA2_/TRDRNA2_88687_c1~~gnl/TRDRNA2_/TRDRNA2_88687_c1_seq1.p2  ORF type:complete len:140 (+),score=19.40 gnl/TRDRNA2_/TRDRNA2_88687_c1_seq1:55-420(+)
MVRAHKAAEILISSDGAVLYASNRAYPGKMLSTICVYTVLADGSLRQKQHMLAPAIPRGMALSKRGGTLIAAGQASGVLETFALGPTGLPSASNSAKISGLSGVAALAVTAGKVRASSEEL